MAANMIRETSLLDRGMLKAAALLVLSGCATTGTPTADRTPPARLDLDQSVGFTITEDARISPSTRAEYDEALAMIEQGRREQGIALLETIVEASPGLSAPRVDLGIAYHQAGDLDAAEAALLDAIELNPAHPVAHNELGIVYRKTGRFAEARASYEAALAIYSGYHFARRNLAVLRSLVR